MAGKLYKFHTIRKFYSFYNYVLHLQLSAPFKAQFKNYCKQAAKVFNRTLYLQKTVYQQGFKEPLTPTAVRGMLPIWMAEPGNGTMRNVPIQVLNHAIADCCRKVEEAFRDKLDFKFPRPITDDYIPLEFVRNVTFNEKLGRINLPGFEDTFKYNMVKFVPATKGVIVGRLKKVWIVFHDGKWLALVLTKAQNSSGRNAAKVLIQKSRVIENEFLPLVYDKTHWITVAHEDRLTSKKERT